MPVGDELVHVREDGPTDAPPLVLVHGFLGSLHWFDRLVPLLSDRFRVIRTDLIGHGASSENGHGYAPEQQARVLRSVLDALGVRAATLVGHSLGGDIVISLVEQGFAATGLVVVDEGPDYTLIRPSRANSLLRVPGLGSLLYRHLPTAAVEAVVGTFFAPGYPARTAFDVPDRPVRDVHAVSYACFKGSQDGKERYVAQRALDARLGAVGVPTLVLFGERDRVYHGAGSAARYRAVSGVTVETTPDAGHSPMLETPAWTAERIGTFLRQS